MKPAFEAHAAHTLPIGRCGSNIAIAPALQHVYGYAVGLDMMRRENQADKPG